MPENLVSFIADFETFGEKKIQILYPKGKMDAHIIHPFIHDRFDPIKLFFGQEEKSYLIKL